VHVAFTVYSPFEYKDPAKKFHTVFLLMFTLAQLYYISQVAVAEGGQGYTETKYKMEDKSINA